MDRNTYTGWPGLARAVRERRKALQLSHSGVARAGGPSHETARNVETQARSTFRELTLSQLDTGLGWKPETAKRIVEGIAPADPADWDEDPDQVLYQVRSRQTGPTGVSPLPVSISSFTDRELLGELVARVTRWDRDYSENNEEALTLLLSLLARPAHTRGRDASRRAG